MSLFKKRAGFSLVELLVVVAIIGVLASLVTVSLNNARRVSRDPKRLTDIKQIQLALKLYFLDNGTYPTFVTPNASIAAGGTSYLLRVPENAKPQSDGGCPDLGYEYNQVQNGQRYALNFCLGSRIDNLPAGPYTATANGILGCPEGYVRVVGSAEFNTTDFCAMKYEAKCETLSAFQSLTSAGAYDNKVVPCTGENRVVSTAAGLPIANVSLAQARSYCEALGAHLMTNNEWMTIARDIEPRPQNWENGTVGVGFMPRGNFGDGFAVQDAADEYAGGELADDFTWYRLLSLSSREKIWDFSGNVSELVDSDCRAGSGLGKYFLNLPAGSATYWDNPNLSDYELGVSGPQLLPWLAGEYYGSYRGCSSDGNIMIRGGAVNDGDREDPDKSPGIYFLDMTKTDDGVFPATGFRCVK